VARLASPNVPSGTPNRKAVSGKFILSESKLAIGGSGKCFTMPFDAPGGEGLGEEAGQRASLMAVEALGLRGLCALLLIGLFCAS
jgi:hypothetical protein